MQGQPQGPVQEGALSEGAGEVQGGLQLHHRMPAHQPPGESRDGGDNRSPFQNSGRLCLVEAFNFQFPDLTAAISSSISCYEFLFCQCIFIELGNTDKNKPSRQDIQKPE